MAKPVYRIERRRRQFVFVCVECGHAVDVGQYQRGAIVNPRTQAAAAITQHARQEHRNAPFVGQE